MTVPPVGSLDGSTTPADRYLDLLRRCLTRYGLGDDFAPIVPSSPPRRRAWQVISRMLSRRRIVVLRTTPEPDEVRARGGDWPIHAETMVGLQRLDNLQACIDQVIRDDVGGDLAETGVWRGGTAILMRAVLAARGEQDRTVWVADSFQGLPRPKAVHPADGSDQHWTYPYLAVSLSEVQANFERYGLLDNRVRFLPGWFCDTLPVAPIERLAVLRVDGDMYGSTMDVLTALYPKVERGGFIIIDDYGAIQGCKLAVDEYRAANGITEVIRTIDWTGVYWRREH
ncbi:MAG: TylF/MycF family methyltransferase [Actinomycetota bacterium]|nr:TylF/MycF family methyltransferase [Actinomycetota bacterium]